MTSTEGGASDLYTLLDATEKDCRELLNIEFIENVSRIEWLGRQPDGSGSFLVVKNFCGTEEEGIIPMTANNMKRKPNVKQNLVRQLTETKGYWPIRRRTAESYRQIGGEGAISSAAVAEALADSQATAERAGSLALAATHTAEQAMTRADSLHERFAGMQEQLNEQQQQLDHMQNVMPEAVVAAAGEYVEGTADSLDGDNVYCNLACKRWAKSICPGCESVFCRTCVVKTVENSPRGLWHCPYCRHEAMPLELNAVKQVEAATATRKRVHESATSLFRSVTARKPQQPPSPTYSPPPTSVASSSSEPILQLALPPAAVLLPPSGSPQLSLSPPPSVPPPPSVETVDLELPSESSVPPSDSTWSCLACTLFNPSSATSCGVCEVERGNNPTSMEESEYEQLVSESRTVSKMKKEQVTEDAKMALQLAEEPARRTRRNM